MSKAGRKLRPGPRFPCGKRTPEALKQEAAETEEQIRSVGVNARLRRHNLKAKKVYVVRDKTGKILSELTGKQIAESDILGSPLQRLRHWNMITPEQADAGLNFATTMREYLSSAKLNKGAPAKANFIPGQPDNGDGAPVRGQAKARAYMEALGEIDRTYRYRGATPSCSAVVWKICYEQEDWLGKEAIGMLRLGLNAIGRVMYGRKAA